MPGHPCCLHMAEEEGRPGILIVGPPNVGKRSILKRLVSGSASADSFDVSSGLTCHGWTIDTKYYSANVCTWIFDLKEREGEDNLRELCERSEALILVFDLDDSTSFETVQNWYLKIKSQNFGILLCVGNKADCIPNHYGHAEYRRKLQNQWESFSDYHPEFWDYGIQQTEGAHLLNGSESFEVRQKSCIGWCLDQGIEYIEACAINEDFDECMSVDGDSQGIARVLGALSAHMWHGMILKPPKPVSASAVTNIEELSSDESEFSLEYELLSNGSAEPGDGDEGPWSFAIQDGIVDGFISQDLQDELGSSSMRVHLEQQSEELVKQPIPIDSPLSSYSVKPQVEPHEEPTKQHIEIDSPSASHSAKSEVKGHEQDEMARATQNMKKTLDRQDSLENMNQRQRNGEEKSVDTMELLMLEMSQMRENLQSMPDSYRREMAAGLAMRMAYMFTDENGSGSE